jgi:hypothetical protein
MPKTGARLVVGRICSRLLLLVAVAGAIAMGPGTGMARPLYRWVDAQGRVHFSQSPPTGGEKFEFLDMPSRPSAPEPTVGDTPAQPAATPAGTPAPTRAGPARVELGKQSAQQVGPSTRLFKGTVKNVGGAEARNVVVHLTVTETQQGAECLQADLDVTPSSLQPGASGTFEAEFDNPCFFDNVSIRMEPDWE